MAYFDNAATTYPKPECVYESMDDYYRAGGGSPGRGDYKIAKSSANLIKDTRELIKEILQCDNKEVVFTPTATLALNMIIQGLVKAGKKNYYISPFEHNAVTRVLHHFEEKGLIKTYQLHVTDCFEYDLERIKYQFEENQPDVVVVSHVSNVIGLIAPLEDIFCLAKKFKSVTVADMSQSAGLVEYDAGNMDLDFAVFAGHKTLYGPTGISGFVMKEDFDLPAVIFGGTGYDSANLNMPESIPERFEMGTMNTVGISGLNAALKWINDVSISKLFEVEKNRRRQLLDLFKQYDYLTVVGDHAGREYVGIVSCLIEGFSSEDAGQIFDRFNVAVRTGLQCAPFAHRFLGTMPGGTIRFSVNYFTKDEDFEELIKVLDYIECNI